MNKGLIDLLTLLPLIISVHRRWKVPTHVDVPTNSFIGSLLDAFFETSTTYHVEFLMRTEEQIVVAEREIFSGILSISFAGEIKFPDDT